VLAARGEHRHSRVTVGELRRFAQAVRRWQARAMQRRSLVALSAAGVIVISLGVLVWLGISDRAEHAATFLAQCRAAGYNPPNAGSHRHGAHERRGASLLGEGRKLGRLDPGF